MNINDLTDEELIELKEDWDNDQYEDSYGIARAVPEWCFADNPERMLNTYPHWVAINQPEFAFERNPLNMAIENNRWVELNRPAYHAIYKAMNRKNGYAYDIGVQPLIG